MATDDSVPELEDILEKNFSEMKIGEEHFNLPSKELKEDIEEKKKIIYQEKYSSESQTGTIVVKPIKATKEIIDTPIEVKDEEEDNEVEVVQEETVSILDKPSSSVGDDFDVMDPSLESLFDLIFNVGILDPLFLGQSCICDKNVARVRANSCPP